jgi:phage FluMu gp28-like protein
MVAGLAPVLQGAHPDDLPAALLSYQQELLSTTAMALVVYEKSRRIGISWAAAAEAASVSSLDAAAGGMDTLYIGYNLDMAREFIGDAAFWLRHMHGFAQASVNEFLFADGDDEGRKEIKAYRIDLPSGHSIIALSSRPRSLRGRQGFVIIDEAAFHEDLAELIKAAMALLIWGGRVWVISTHDGADNPFNELVQEVRAKKRKGLVLRTTFDDAVQAGLYRRVCLRKGIAWSAADEAAWVQEVREFYGEDAAEELDVIPSQGSGTWLSRAVIEACMKDDSKVAYWVCPDGFELQPEPVRHAAADAFWEDQVVPLLGRLDRSALSFLGGDFGRSGDITSLWPGQLIGAVLRVPFTVELRNAPFDVQERILFRLGDALPRFVAGALDARGLCASMSEKAMQRWGEHIVQVKATQDWYRENMPPFKARFEDRTIEIPKDEDSGADLRMVKLTRGVASVPENTRRRSPRGGFRHGDAAIAGAMLNFAAAQDVIDYGYDAAPRSPCGFDGGTPESRGGRFSRHSGAY